MGWEQRGKRRYYYRKEREGSGKSVYVGRSEIANLISSFESHSTEMENLLRAKKSIEVHEIERIEGAIDRVVELGPTVHPSNVAECGISHASKAMETQKEVSVDFEKVITDKAEETRTKFRALLDKTNKENPAPKMLRLSLSF